jgi:hypothetical protein
MEVQSLHTAKTWVPTSSLSRKRQEHPDSTRPQSAQLQGVGTEREPALRQPLLGLGAGPAGGCLCTILQHRTTGLREGKGLGACPRLHS